MMEERPKKKKESFLLILTDWMAEGNKTILFLDLETQMLSSVPSFLPNWTNQSNCIFVYSTHPAWSELKLANRLPVKVKYKVKKM